MSRPTVVKHKLGYTSAEIAVLALNKVKAAKPYKTSSDCPVLIMTH